MGSAIPKQYLDLNGKAVIDWALQRLLSHPDIEMAIVALSAEDVYWSGTRSATDPRIRTVTGGMERCHSVLNALQMLAEEASKDDWVLVHDAARPCVRVEDISRLIQVASTGIGGVLGAPVHDTMKRTAPNQHILQTVDRSNLWHAFTPQMFPLGLLKEALSGALEEGVRVTDEASAMEWAGYQPLMVESASTNIKITRPGDLALAAFYLSM